VGVTTAEIEHNIRFPGQYEDEETGLHYNYFRDYDPTLGRYVESDPIGLGGGINTFSYVDSNAISKYDQYGLLGRDGSTKPPGKRKGPFGGSCGPSGKDSRFWIPDGPFKSACDFHDECYGVCGVPKWVCDVKFFADTGYSGIHLLGVTIFGNGPYNDAQSKCDNCDR